MSSSVSAGLVARGSSRDIPHRQESPGALAPVLILLLLLAGCAVPLGPGFSIERQQVEFDYAGGEVAEVRSVYRLRNTGNEPLEKLHVNLPHGLANFRATIDGRTADALLTESYVEDAPVPPSAAATITFSPPLGMNRRVELTLEYTAPVRAAHPSAAAADSAAFYLPAESWFPELVRPAAMFARGGARADDVRVTFLLPEGWRMLMPGRAEQPRTRNGRVEQRIRLRSADGAPYILAGRYHEHAVSAHGQTVVLWTHRPVGSAADPALLQIAEDLALLESQLGPLTGGPGGPPVDRRGPTIWIAEKISLGRDVVPPLHDVTVMGFPGGLMLDAAAIAGLAESTPPSGYGRQLASLWFEQLTRPETGLEQVLAWELARGIGGDARRDYAGLETIVPIVRDLIREHDEAASRITDRPLSLLASGTAEEQLVARRRTVLFFTAVNQPMFGIEGMEMIAGLRRMVQARRGDTWNRHDLRAALELESGQDLAEMFRRWLDEPGIPEDFRARYAPGTR
jgi:hypothetical protein